MRHYRKKPKIDQNKPKMTFVKSLGKGTYGSVDLFSYTRHDGSTSYNAVKISDSKYHNSIHREFRVLSKLRGRPGIVQSCGTSLLQETDSNGKKVYKMAIEYAPGGNLTDFIRINRRLSDSVIKDFTRMILQGLVSVHEHGYVHCDLKPENLLLFPRHDQEARFCSYELKISDFGLTIKAGEESVCWETESPFVGTPLYMSPESVRDGGGANVERTLDLWSLGCIVLEMCTGRKHPWLGSSVDEIKSRLLSGEAPEIAETVTCDAREFIEKCFARKSEERGSACELLLHPFLNGERKVNGAGGGGGERRRVGLRVRKPPSRFEDIAKKPLKLKVISSKSSKFKSVSNKPLKMKILPTRLLRSNFVPIQ